MGDKIQIRHKDTQAVLFETEAHFRKEAVAKAVAGGADLGGANLGGAKLPWWSHDMIAEILFREAGGDIDKRKVAGLILVSRDWCWDEWLTFASDPLFGWAMDALAARVVADDDAPASLRDHAKKLAKIAPSSSAQPE